MSLTPNTRQVLSKLQSIIEFLSLNLSDLYKKISLCNTVGDGGGGKRRGLGARNDVLTTCKAVTLHGGQRIIAVFLPQYIFLEPRSVPSEEIRND